MEMKKRVDDGTEMSGDEEEGGWWDRDEWR